MAKRENFVIIAVIFIGRLIDVILSQHCVSSDFMSNLYCFSTQLLIEGGKEYIFEHFNSLMPVLERCKVVSNVEAKSEIETFPTFVVDIRSRHVSIDQKAEGVIDIVSFLLADYSFLARKNFYRVIKLCCPVVVKPRR